MREHLVTGEDLPQTLRSLRVAGDGQRARGGRGGSRDLAGGDVRPRLLVGGPCDRGILGLAVTKVDRTVVDKIAITKGEIYNVGGGPENQRNLLEVIDQVGELTGKKPQFTFADWREGDQAYYVSDTSKAKQQLAWEPKIDFDRGLRDLIAWAESVS